MSIGLVCVKFIEMVKIHICKRIRNCSGRRIRSVWNYICPTYNASEVPILESATKAITLNYEYTFEPLSKYMYCTTM
jgi:hypothetical protein